MLKGDERRAHIAGVTKTFKATLAPLILRHAHGLSYAETYAACLSALEEIAGKPAEVIWRAGEVCADEYCKADGGRYENIADELRQIYGKPTRLRTRAAGPAGMASAPPPDDAPVGPP